jgi:hypothetical protein
VALPRPKVKLTRFGRIWKSRIQAPHQLDCIIDHIGERVFLIQAAAFLAYALTLAHRSFIAFEILARPFADTVKTTQNGIFWALNGHPRITACCLPAVRRPSPRNTDGVIRHAPKKRVGKRAFNYCSASGCQKEAAAQRAKRYRDRKRSSKPGSVRDMPYRGLYRGRTNDPLFSP